LCDSRLDDEFESNPKMRDPENERRTPSQEERRHFLAATATRIKARVLACIPSRGFQEEIAVSREDLSKAGLSLQPQSISRRHPRRSRRAFTPGFPAPS